MAVLGARGRVHITEVEDESAPVSASSPLDRISAGDSIQAAVLGVMPTKEVLHFSSAMFCPTVA